jgi:hypothetical protein
MVLSNRSVSCFLLFAAMTAFDGFSPDSVQAQGFCFVSVVGNCDDCYQNDCIGSTCWGDGTLCGECS